MNMAKDMQPRTQPDVQRLTQSRTADRFAGVQQLIEPSVRRPVSDPYVCAFRDELPIPADGV